MTRNTALRYLFGLPVVASPAVAALVDAPKKSISNKSPDLVVTIHCDTSEVEANLKRVRQLVDELGQSLIVLNDAGRSLKVEFIDVSATR